MIVLRFISGILTRFSETEVFRKAGG